MTSHTESQNAFIPEARFPSLFATVSTSQELEATLPEETPELLQAAEIPIRPNVDMPIKPGVETPIKPTEEPPIGDEEDEVDMPIKPEE